MRSPDQSREAQKIGSEIARREARYRSTTAQSAVVKAERTKPRTKAKTKSETKPRRKGVKKMELLKTIIQFAFSLMNTPIKFGNFSFSFLQVAIALAIMGIAISAIASLFHRGD